MTKLLLMLCIASGLVASTTFTIESDKQPQEKPAITDLEKLFDVDISEANRKLGIGNIDLNNIKPDFSFYMALDSWAFTWEELQQMKANEERRHQGEIVIGAKQLAAQNAASEKEEKK